MPTQRTEFMLAMAHGWSLLLLTVDLQLELTVDLWGYDQDPASARSWRATPSWRFVGCVVSLVSMSASYFPSIVL
jgi:hypothetical protein